MSLLWDSIEEHLHNRGGHSRGVRSSLTAFLQSIPTSFSKLLVCGSDSSHSSIFYAYKSIKLYSSVGIKKLNVNPERVMDDSQNVTVTLCLL